MNEKRKQFAQMLLRLTKLETSKLFRSFNGHEMYWLGLIADGCEIDDEDAEKLNKKIQQLDNNMGGYISWKWKMNNK